MPPAAEPGAEPAHKPRTGYKHELSYYAKELGYAPRNIKRWVKVGRDAKQPDLPPFDDPPAMLPWWQRMQQAGGLKQRPPDRLLAYAQKKDESAAPATTTPPADPPPPSGVKPGAAPAYDFSSETGGGLEESVREFRRILAANQQRLKTAMLATPLDESFVTSCQRNVEKMLDLLRKSEGNLFDMQLKRGDLVPLADVRQDWATLLSSVKMMRQRMVDNIAAALSDKLAPDLLSLVRAAIEQERAREEAVLRSSVFWRRTPDVSSVTTPSA